MYVWTIYFCCKRDCAVQVFFSKYFMALFMEHSQSVTMTLCCKQVVFFLYFCIFLFLSISRGTWQSTLWLWTSTTCFCSTPVCCMNGASSLPQASSALWVHSLQVILSSVLRSENISNNATNWRMCFLNIYLKLRWSFLFLRAVLLYIWFQYVRCMILPGGLLFYCSSITV